MKKIYEFIKEKKEQVDQPTKEKDPKTGEEVTVIRKANQITKKKYFLRNATRSMVDSNDLFYSKQWSEFVKQGLLTRAMLAKRFDDDDGIFSRKESVRYQRISKELVELFEQKKKLSEAKKNEKKIKEINQKIDALSSHLQEYENAQNAAYENTAEYKARDRSIMWWILFLSCEEVSGKEVEIFKPKDDLEEDTYENRLSMYDDIIESDDKFNIQVIKEFAHLITCWVMGVSRKEEFDELLKQYREDAPVN